jgi:hypothetical protein
VLQATLNRAGKDGVKETLPKGYQLSLALTAEGLRARRVRA